VQAIITSTLSSFILLHISRTHPYLIISNFPLASNDMHDKFLQAKALILAFFLNNNAVNLWIAYVLSTSNYASPQYNMHSSNYRSKINRDSTLSSTNLFTN